MFFHVHSDTIVAFYSTFECNKLCTCTVSSVRGPRFEAVKDMEPALVSDAMP